MHARGEEKRGCSAAAIAHQGGKEWFKSVEGRRSYRARLEVGMEEEEIRRYFGIKTGKRFRKSQNWAGLRKDQNPLRKASSAVLRTAAQSSPLERKKRNNTSTRTFEKGEKKKKRGHLRRPPQEQNQTV